MSLSDNTTSLPEYITFAQLHEFYGFPRTTVYRQIKTCGFPRPIQMGPNSVRLRKSDVEDWINSRPLAPVHGNKEGAA